MKALCSVMLLAMLFLARAGIAANTNNYSDQWLDPDEPGWGASVHQQASVLFVNLFVYGADRNPTFFSAAAYLQPGMAPDHDLFTGDLYVSNGPWFGAGAFDPGTVAARKVGTLTFSAVGMAPATLSYTVDGVAVTKSVTRQNWALEDLACQDGIGNGHYEYSGTIEIAKVLGGVGSDSLDITIPGNGSCAFTVPITQSGHLGGGVVGQYNCPDRKFGAGALYAAERSIAGIVSRYEASFIGSFMGQPTYCTAYGRLAGVRR